jgi:rhodanese-related sulfurtransferase
VADAFARFAFVSLRRIHLPLAEEDSDGNPVMNPRFKEIFGALRRAHVPSRFPFPASASSRLLTHALASIHPPAHPDNKFKNKMSRVIIACDDGGRRSEIAAEMVTGLGYTAIVTIEGGIDAHLLVSPLEDKDKKARVARVEQFVGIKYGGTGVTSNDTPDDSA